MRDRIIYLDRDGVINQQAAVHEYISRWEDFVFLPGVKDAIRRFHEAGFRVLIMSNQRGIARGKITAGQVDAIHEKMCREIRDAGGQIDGVYVCPHENDTCTCRKPQIGLFLQAEKRFTVDKDKSFMIGDSDSDIQAGRNYGVRTIKIGAKENTEAEHYCSSLSEAADYICIQCSEQ